MDKDRLNRFLISILYGKIPNTIIEEKVDEYIKEKDILKMAGFILNDIKKVFGENPEKIKEICILMEEFFGKDRNEIIQSAKNIIDNNIRLGNMSIEENHKIVNETLKMLCKKLNENNVDYYLVGALPCYLLTGSPDTRYHDDIDLMLNEKDIPKVAELLADTEFSFEDKRLHTPKRMKESATRPGGDHEVVAQHKNSEFHIGFFCFERGNDNEIIHKDYFIDNDGILKTYSHMLTKESSQLNYDDELYTHEDVSFRMASLESTYRIKKSTMNNQGRDKDKTDVEMIEKSGKLNLEKMRKMNELPHLESVIKPVEKIPYLYVTEEKRKENEIQREEERQSLLQQKKDLERNHLLEQKEQQEIQNSESFNQDKGMVRKLVPNIQTQNSENKNGFTNVLLLSLITSGFVLLVALLTSLFIK